MQLLCLHGPNLNLLGSREPGIYGSSSLRQIDTALRQRATELGASIDCVQSNHEGALVDRIHQAQGQVAGILINAGAYTHTSIAIRDALLGVAIPTWSCISATCMPVSPSATTPIWPTGPWGWSAGSVP